MIKKVIKAFDVIDALVVTAIICFLIALFIPTFMSARNRHMHEHSSGIMFKIGDTVYIDALSVTGIVINVNTLYDNPRATLLVKGINGLPTEIEPVDIRLLKKVPPSSKSEWKR